MCKAKRPFSGRLKLTVRDQPLSFTLHQPPVSVKAGNDNHSTAIFSLPIHIINYN